MGRLSDDIRQAVVEDRFAVTHHADERLRERRLELWQIVGDVDRARLLSERPHDEPNPSVELEQALPDGTPVRVVWAWVAAHRLAVLVTVYYVEPST